MKELDHQEIKRLKDMGWSYTKIGRLMNVDTKTVRTRVDPEYAEAMREFWRDRSAHRRLINKTFNTDKLGLGLGNGPRPTADILSLRDYRLSIPPRDLTAHLLGDPIPGESALDRKLAGAGA